MEPRSSGFRGRFPRPTALEWICLAGGLVLTIRYAWILDDAYVFCRYADNLTLLGRGLVYNEGEFAEGFSSPLWVLLLSAIRVLRLDYWTIVQVLGALSFTFFWALLVVVNRRLSPGGARVLNLPLLYLSFHYGTSSYFTSGTESPLVQCLVPAFALYLLAPRRVALQFLVALAPLVRNELAVTYAFALAWFWIRERAFPLRLLVFGAALPGSWMLFRIYYYADLFPVTFYLKNAFDPAQGFRYLHDTLLPYGGYLLALGAVVLIGFAKARGWPRLPARRERAVMCTVAALLAAYVVKVGGDARHYRYLSFCFPLAIIALGGLVELWLTRTVFGRSRLTVFGLGLALASGTLWLHPRQVEHHPFLRREGQHAVDQITDAHHHRFHTALPAVRPLEASERIRMIPRYREAEAEERSGYEDVLVHQICWNLYQNFRRYGVHQLGLTEPILARVDLPFDRPGHKFGLVPLAHDLAEVRLWWGKRPERGMYAAAVEAGVAAPWIAAGLETIEVIERKIYNRHDLFENLRLAFLFPPKITAP